MGSRPSKRSLETVNVSIDIMGIVFFPILVLPYCFCASPSFPYMIAPGLVPIITHVCSMTFAADDIVLHYEVYFYSVFYVVVPPSHDLL